MDSTISSRTFIEALPFSKALGMKLEAIGEGHAIISMPYDERLIGDPRTGVIHGGAVSALMDTTSGASVMSAKGGSGVTATLDLRIDYMRPARPGQRITCEAFCYHTTRTVAFVRATAMDEEDGSQVASSVGAFTFQRKEARS
ncbi:PaaI family thioesterase [Tropicimonas sediminicola]|nr:PaaI family thioesterase [Tropicimonas sediminicola]